MISAAFYLLGSYLIGSIPTGPILATLYADVDVTTQGSGNIGATNVHRILGRRFGIATLVGDILKGLIPVLGATAVSDWTGFPSLVALATFIGHCWPAYLEFRGGKGVATAGGALLGMAPFVTLLTAAVWMIVLLAFKRPSVSALAATVTLPALIASIRPDLIDIPAIPASG